MDETDIDFIKESNRIEGILRDPTDEEIKEFHRFMDLENVTYEDLITFVSVYQPDAQFRIDPKIPGVRVGNHIAPDSGIHIKYELQSILFNRHDNGPWKTHVAYEKLHPFTDGNGRSGRMLWAHQMGWDGLELGFLHKFYYQTLDGIRRENNQT